MIEVVVGVWLGSLLLSMVITAVNVRYALNLMRSSKYKVLNKNLVKVEKYWSLTTENFKNLGDGSAKNEEDQMIRTSIYLGGLGLLGAPGLLFLIVISVSMHFLAKSRFTRRVFQSELVTNTELSAEQIIQIVGELKST